MFWANKEKKASLYYLYMMADGDVSYSEEKFFDQLCNEMEIPSSLKTEIIEKSKQLRKGGKDILGVIVDEKIDDEAGQSLWGLDDTSALARIIWNLVNLGYADSVYSDEEKKIVNYLATKWSVDKEILQEFIDSADTMLALVKQKEWIASTFKKGAERDTKDKETDIEINMLLDDVKLTIQELTI